MAIAEASRRRPLAVMISLGVAGLLIIVFAIVLTVRALSHSVLVYMGDAGDVRAAGAVFVPGHHAFVAVWQSTFVVVPNTAPTGNENFPSEGIKYCASSGWFEGLGVGSKFDRLGYYRMGPAPRGLSRYPTEVHKGRVYANLSKLQPGPPRGEHSTQGKEGQFCG